MASGCIISVHIDALPLAVYCICTAGVSGIMFVEVPWAMEE
jgi:hypothetical protein